MAKKPVHGSKRIRRARGVGATVAIPPRAASNRSDESIRIRPISNGWIISRSRQHRGRYEEHEEFSAQRPVLTAKPVRPGKTARPTPRARRR